MSNNETTKQPHEPKLTCAKGHPIEWNRVYRNRVYRCLECGDFPDVDASRAPSSAATLEQTSDALQSAAVEIARKFSVEIGAEDWDDDWLTKFTDAALAIIRKYMDAPPSPQTSELVAGEPCPTCKRKYLGEMGPGEYSCVLCGMGMVEPCEHWKNDPTNFLSTTALPSCHVCGDQMIGLCKKCGARTDPQSGEPPAQGIGGHNSCVICGITKLVDALLSKVAAYRKEKP